MNIKTLLAIVCLSLASPLLYSQEKKEKKEKKQQPAKSLSQKIGSAASSLMGAFFGLALTLSMSTDIYEHLLNNEHIKQFKNKHIAILIGLGILGAGLGGTAGHSIMAYFQSPHDQKKDLDDTSDSTT